MHSESIEVMQYFVDQTKDHFGDMCPVRVLDVGSRSVAGQSTYRDLFPTNKYAYFGLDMRQGENVDIVVDDAYDWKLGSKFEMIVSGQAFEHIDYPWVTIKLIYEHLHNNGLAILIAPTVPTVHRFPVDCWRILPDGWVALATWAGFQVLHAGMHYRGEWNDSYCLLRKP